jgi:hypothetical protein
MLMLWASPNAVHLSVFLDMVTAGNLSLLCFVREQADGVLSYAAVPHGGLWPPIPP